MASPENHPLPAPPQQQARYYSQQPQQQYQQQPQQYQQQHQQQQHQAQPQHHQPPYHAHQPPPVVSQKPTTKPRSFSFRSDKSHKSSGSNHKIDFHETSAEKAAKRLHSKADPTLAMNEAEPSAVQANAKTSMAPLRAIQHRDTTGNPIAEPDRSNPTRSRWERPLDTIRSFEAAIDGGYSRKSYIRTDGDSVMTGAGTRRSSYYGNNGPRFPQDSYYGGRPQSFRPESTQFELRPHGRESYMDPQGHNGGGGYGPGPSRQRAPRMHSEPQMNAYRGGDQQHVYPIPHKDRSYETVTSAAGSGNSEPAGYQTDPTSSDNSSIDRVTPAKRPDPANDYGIGFAQPAAYQAPAFNFGGKGANGAGPPPNQYQRVPVPSNLGAGPPPPPPKESNVLRREPTQLRPDLGEKRKSWFARRFSKAS